MTELHHDNDDDNDIGDSIDSTEITEARCGVHADLHVHFFATGDDAFWSNALLPPETRKRIALIGPLSETLAILQEDYDNVKAEPEKTSDTQRRLNALSSRRRTVADVRDEFKKLCEPADAHTHVSTTPKSFQAAPGLFPDQFHNLFNIKGVTINADTVKLLLQWNYERYGDEGTQYVEFSVAISTLLSFLHVFSEFVIEKRKARSQRHVEFRFLAAFARKGLSGDQSSYYLKSADEFVALLDSFGSSGQLYAEEIDTLRQIVAADKHNIVVGVDLYCNELIGPVVPFTWDAFQAVASPDRLGIRIHLGEFPGDELSKLGDLETEQQFCRSHPASDYDGLSCADSSQIYKSGSSKAQKCGPANTCQLERDQPATFFVVLKDVLGKPAHKATRALIFLSNNTSEITGRVLQCTMTADMSNEKFYRHQDAVVAQFTVPTDRSGQFLIRFVDDMGQTARFHVHVSSQDDDKPVTDGGLVRLYEGDNRIDTFQFWDVDDVTPFAGLESHERGFRLTSPFKRSTPRDLNVSGLCGTRDIELPDGADVGIFVRYGAAPMFRDRLCSGIVRLYVNSSTRSIDVLFAVHDVWYVLHVDVIGVVDDVTPIEIVAKHNALKMAFSVFAGYLAVRKLRRHRYRVRIGHGYCLTQWIDVWLRWHCGRLQKSISGSTSFDFQAVQKSVHATLAEPFLLEATYRHPLFVELCPLTAVALFKRGADIVWNTIRWRKEQIVLGTDDPAYLEIHERNEWFAERTGLNPEGWVSQSGLLRRIRPFLEELLRSQCTPSFFADVQLRARKAIFDRAFSDSLP